MEYRKVNSEIINFCREHLEDWREILSAPPYSLIIKEEDGLVLFKYNQILSDFSLPLCREARGFITSTKFNSVYCRSFNKFFNYGEKYADDIDWSSAKVQEKVDGSIIRVWWNKAYGKWQISTSGTIDAFRADVSNSGLTFGDLFLVGLEKSLKEYGEGILDTEKTHVFELVSPESRVVVPYKETEIYYLTSFFNDSGIEEKIESPCFKTPKEFPLRSVEDCIAACSQMDINQEGFVVVDKNFNRIKIKSPAYLAAHRIGNNGAITDARIVDLIRTNIVDDFTAIFPEYKEKIENIFYKIRFYLMEQGNWIRILNDTGKFNLTRKEFALYIKGNIKPIYHILLFLFYDKKFDIDNVDDFCYNWLMSKSEDKILEIIGGLK